MEVKKSFYNIPHHEFEISKYDEVVCNYCGNEAYEKIADELNFEIRCCAKCGLVYVNPQPAAEELPKFYEGMYVDTTDEESERRSLGYVERHLARIVNQRKPEGGSMLEIGCGFGNQLKKFEGGDWSLDAIEASEKAAAYAEGHVDGLTVHRGTVETVDFDAESLDCIIMAAVLEHVKDPHAVFDRLRRWMKPGGLLVILVPYTTPFIRAKRWIPNLPIYFEAPRHLFDYGPVVLKKYFEDYGFRNIVQDIGRPYASPTLIGALLIWGVKIPGLILYYLTGGRYIYPYAGAIVVHGVKAD